MLTRTEESGITSTETPFVGSAAPKVSCTRLMKPPFMPSTPGTSRTEMATIFSITPLENVSESSESRSSSASENVRSPDSLSARTVESAGCSATSGSSVVSSTFAFVLMLAPIRGDAPHATMAPLVLLDQLLDDADELGVAIGELPQGHAGHHEDGDDEGLEDADGEQQDGH